MTLRELLDTLQGLGVKLTLHDGDTITIEPPDALTPAVRAALTEHRAALVALIRSVPSLPSSFDALMTAFDGYAPFGRAGAGDGLTEYRASPRPLQLAWPRV
jgi:hypothetical protein